MYIAQVSGERLQDHWSSGLDLTRGKLCFACLAETKKYADQPFGNQETKDRFCSSVILTDNVVLLP